MRQKTKVYKESKINTIRFNEFDPLLGVHQQYKTLEQDIDKSVSYTHLTLPTTPYV